MLTKKRETQQSEARTRTSAPMMDREGEGEFGTPRSGFRLEQLSPIDMYSRRHKRLKVNEGKIGSIAFEAKYKRRESLHDVVDYSDPFSVPNLEEELSRGMYGSASKEILELQARKIRLFNSISALYPSLSIHRPNLSPQTPKSDDRPNTGNTEVPESADRRSGGFESQNVIDVIDVDDDCMIVDTPSSKDSRFSFRSSRETEESVGSIQHPTGKHDAAGHVQVSNAQNGLENLVILDSDEEDLGEQGTCNSTSTDTLCHEVRGCPDESRWQETVATETVISTVPDASQQASYQYQEVFLKKPTDEKTTKDFADKNVRESKVVKEQQSLTVETEVRRDKGVYLGVQDDIARKKSDIWNGAEDELADVWREMTLALEFTKDATEEAAAVDCSGEEDEGCDHSFFLKDDLGYVCRVCGLIQKSIETIFDYQWGKVQKSTRTYMHESRESKDREQNYATLSGLNISQQNVAVAEISVHPRHMKQMKAHQLEGFNFLARNLVADEPGGCILAHAPGSGKTFMIISFVQSFLARYPNAKPLVVLPKGIVDTWKKEFKKWQIEDLLLYDLYSSKAEKRSEQLEILKEWVDHKGVMFLGYKQFSNIVCSSASDKVAAACHDILLKVPTILILDEGHTPRNDETDVLNSLAKVQTPRKVVLSGTLFQNHVKEVFTILNLVRPKFLKLDSSKAIKRRIMSRVQISGGRRQLKAGGGDPSFYELVEETLQHDENFGRKVGVIHDLREMTSRVLHYYKGDFLDELPGLVDFTVLLNLSAKQKHQVEKLKKMEKFKRSSLGSAVYLHPHLKEFSETALLRDKGSNFEEAKMDNLLNTLDVRDGVKAKFFLNILALCESSGEKLLVFSQYLLPLKFLEKLVLKNKGWRPGKEVFIISGDSNTEQREWSTEQFNSSSDAKVLFGSIKACGEGISLVGASRVIVLDVHLNPSVTRQAVGRAFRPGQVRKVYIYRLVAAESPEQEDHQTSFRKELISKMWFEWSECYGQKDFQMDSVDPKETDDVFWGSPLLGEDVKLLYTR